MNTYRLIVLFLVLTFAVHGQSEESEHVYYDILKILPEKWETSEGLTVPLAGKEIAFRNTAHASGWATTPEHIPFHESQVAELGVSKLVSGNFIIQIEWFGEDDGYIGVTELFNARDGVSHTWSRRLTECLPSEGTPKKFRLKFWLEGKNSEIDLTSLAIRGRRGWQNPATQVIRSYGPDDVGLTEDLSIEHGEKAIAAVVNTDAEAGNFVLPNKVYYNSDASVMLDVESLYAGKISLKGLCWDDQGRFLEEIDMIHSINAPGLYEQTLRSRESSFPPSTAQISFKIWLEGKGASARINGLYYGVAP